MHFKPHPLQTNKQKMQSYITNKLTYYYYKQKEFFSCINQDIGCHTYKNGFGKNRGSRDGYQT